MKESANQVIINLPEVLGNISVRDAIDRPAGIPAEKPFSNEQFHPVNGNHAPLGEDEEEEQEEDLILGDEDELEGDEDEYEVELEEDDPDEADIDEDDLVIDTDEE